jgi:hypothetical protein
MTKKSNSGLGYNKGKTGNNQKVQKEGICWSIIFESAVQRIGLEVGESSIEKLSN